MANKIENKMMQEKGAAENQLRNFQNSNKVSKRL